MSLDRLAYIGLETQRIREWQKFASGILGMETVTDRGSLQLRMDVKPFRLTLRPGAREVMSYVGWEYDSLDDLCASADHLRSHGVEVEEGMLADCEERSVERLFRFSDPAGNVVELCHGHHDAPTPPVFPRPMSGFKTGACGLGHIVYSNPEIAPLADFYEAMLGFHTSDSAADPFPARFMHMNSRHHSLAFVQTPKNGVHHLMVELYAFDDVGQAYDRAQMQEGLIGATLGRHTNDYMTSFYVLTPSDFMVEYGWGGRMIDPEHWAPEELHNGPSLWGHERQWLQEPQRTHARELRLRAAERGIKAPLQLSSGFFDVVSN